MDVLTLSVTWHSLAYSADLTSNKNVSALAWNQKNPDLLAVGYGPFEYNDQHDGLVCCWTLKNQEVACQGIRSDDKISVVDLVSGKILSYGGGGHYSGFLQEVPIIVGRKTSLLMLCLC